MGKHLQRFTFCCLLSLADTCELYGIFYISPPHSKINGPIRLPPIKCKCMCNSFTEKKKGLRCLHFSLLCVPWLFLAL